MNLLNPSQLRFDILGCIGQSPRCYPWTSQLELQGSKLMSVQCVYLQSMVIVIYHQLGSWGSVLEDNYQGFFLGVLGMGPGPLKLGILTSKTV